MRNFTSKVLLTNFPLMRLSKFIWLYALAVTTNSLTGYICEIKYLVVGYQDRREYENSNVMLLINADQDCA